MHIPQAPPTFLRGISLLGMPRSIASMQSPCIAIPGAIDISVGVESDVADIAKLGAAALRIIPSASASVRACRVKRLRNMALSYGREAVWQFLLAILLKIGRVL